MRRFKPWIGVIVCAVFSTLCNGQPGSLEDAARKAVEEAAREIQGTPPSGPTPLAAPSEAPQPILVAGPTADRDSTPRRGSTSKQNLFGRRSGPRPPDSQLSTNAALISERAADTLRNRSLPLNNALRQAVSASVQRLPGLSTRKSFFCDSNAKYRTADGSCNNLGQHQMGAAGQPQSRFVPPQYGDPWNLGFVPRSRAKDGSPLPSPRVISNEIFRSLTSSPTSNKLTVTFTHFGQFVDHDVIATPIFAEPNGDPIECCNGDFPVFRSECFPFSTPPGDFTYTCMNLVRSLPASTFPFLPAPRQQINDITSWLDLSSVYGSSSAEQSRLRDINGLLKEGSNGLLPDEPPGFESCADRQHSCFLAGDHRNSEVPPLTLWHTVFLREHNRIAKKLRSKFGWNSDKTFQETRKILIAIYQHIVFNEFLPPLLGFNWSKYVGLLSKPEGHCTWYSPNLDGSTRNSFGAAAYRMGHSLVGNFVGASNSVFQETGKELLQDTFFETGQIRDDVNYGATKMGRWMSATYGRQMDRFFSDQLRNHLFEVTKGIGLDLGALNIQRGRDHGLPGYNKFREFCGLRPAYLFTNTYGGLVDHNLATVFRLKSIYKHPDDIDLYAGGLSERAQSPNTILGPTFRCLIGLQFLYYKYADRFFYENNFPQTGFTVAQLNDIKKQTLAGIYCRTLDINQIQPQLFLHPDNT